MFINLYEFKKQLKYWGIEYTVKDWDISVSGGDSRARQHYRNVLAENDDLRARLILDTVMNDATMQDLKDTIEERAAIRCSDNSPYDLVSAVKCYMQGVKK